MSMLQIGILGVAGVLLALQFKSGKSEYGIYISIVLGLLIFATLLGKISLIKDVLNEINGVAGPGNDYWKTLWKILGITYAAEFSSAICKDAGYQTIALQIEVFAKITILVLSLPVPKDLSGIKTKVALNLTKRQIICFSGAAVAGIPLYFLTKGLIGTSAASLLMMGAMLPFFFFAMYEKNGFPAEKILYFMLRQKILTPGIRPYRSENLYKQLEEKEKLRREVRYLEEKAKGRTGKPQKKQL